MLEIMVIGDAALVGTDKHHEVVLPRVVGERQQVAPGVVFLVCRRKVLPLAFPLLLHGGQRLPRPVHGDGAARLGGNLRQALRPLREPCLKLRAARHGDVHVAHRVGRDNASVNEDLPVHHGEQVGGKFAVETFREFRLLVQADEQVGGVLLLHGVGDAAHHVHRPAAVRLYLHIGSGGNLHRLLQPLAALGSSGGIVFEHHVERGDAALLALGLQHQGDVYQRAHGFGVGNGEHDAPAFRRVGLRIGRRAAGGHLAGGAVGDERTDHTRHEYQHHRPVEHVVVEQARAVGQYDFIPHEHNGQRGGGARSRQPEHQAAVVGLHLEYLLRGKGGQPFGGDAREGHHRCHEDCSAVAEGAQVDEHTHADEEVGNEEGIAHKLHVRHQRRGGRNEAVERKAGEERAENALNAHHLHKSRTEEHEHKYEYILHHAVVVAAEEPPPYGGKRNQYARADEHHLHHEPQPVEPRHLLLEHAAHHGEHQKRQRVGHNGAAHRDAHARQARNAVAQHYGIGNQRVRGVHRRHKHRRRHGIAGQHGAVHAKADGHGNGETQKPQRQRPPLDFLHVLQVHLEAGEEHYII